MVRRVRVTGCSSTAVAARRRSATSRRGSRRRSAGLTSQLEELGIEPLSERVTPHSLRRTYASLRFARATTRSRSPSSSATRRGLLPVGLREGRQATPADSGAPGRVRPGAGMGRNGGEADSTSGDQPLRSSTDRVRVVRSGPLLCMESNGSARDTQRAMSRERGIVDLPTRLTSAARTSCNTWTRMLSRSASRHGPAHEIRGPRQGGVSSWRVPPKPGKLGRYRAQGDHRGDGQPNPLQSIAVRVFRGRDGIEIDRELPRAIFTFRNGLIVRIDGFTDKAEALEAAGLSE